MFYNFNHCNVKKVAVLTIKKTVISECAITEKKKTVQEFDT